MSLKLDLSVSESNFLREMCVSRAHAPGQALTLVLCSLSRQPSKVDVM